MRLREDINYSEFINEIKKCKADVFFCTEKGDALNLKSVLSGYVFSILVNKKDFKRGIVKCSDKEDEKNLIPFAKKEL